MKNKKLFIGLVLVLVVAAAGTYYFTQGNQLQGRFNKNLSLQGPTANQQQLLPGGGSNSESGGQSQPADDPDPKLIVSMRDVGSSTFVTNELEHVFHKVIINASEPVTVSNISYRINAQNIGPTPFGSGLLGNNNSPNFLDWRLINADTNTLLSQVRQLTGYNCEFGCDVIQTLAFPESISLIQGNNKIKLIGDVHPALPYNSADPTKIQVELKVASFVVTDANGHSFTYVYEDYFGEDAFVDHLDPHTQETSKYFIGSRDVFKSEWFTQTQ
ncbi:hypothetical protein KKC94_02835 [Patescibacteria group bacterium]|nr:hypothetical protein [Patescibacteria group bacterium]